MIGKEQGLTGASIGALTSAFGLGLLVGALLSPVVRRVVPIRTILRLELWAWIGCAAFVAWPNPCVLAIGFLPVALAIPSTDSIVKAIASR